MTPNNDPFANIRAKMAQMPAEQVQAVALGVMLPDGPEFSLDPAPRDKHTLDAHMITAAAHLHALAMHLDEDIETVADDVVGVYEQLEEQGAVSISQERGEGP